MLPPSIYRSLNHLWLNKCKVFYSQIMPLSRVYSTNCTVTLTEDGRKMELHCADDHEIRRYHGIWLRHNCRCPECYSERTNMIRLPTALASGCKDITSVAIEDSSKVLVKWQNTDHTGVFPLDWLKNNDYSSDHRRKNRHKAQQPLIARSLPVSDYREIVSSDEGAYRWLRDINYYGMSLITNIEKPKGALLKLTNIFPHVLHYFGKTHEITQKEDSDDLGESNEGLNLHQDLVYYENPPGLIGLNCIRNDECVEGGVSVIVDMYPVIEELRVNYPKSFRILATTPVTFQREILGTENELDLRITKRHIELDESGEVTAFHWNIPHIEPLCAHEDLVEDYYEAVADMARLMNEPQRKLSHRLNRGECLFFNNRRVVHGRTPFQLNGGIRRLGGVFVHTDYLRSQFLVLGKKLGKNELSTRAFMHSLF